MRVFVAGASGVIGLRLLPLLVAAGHEVAAMTRSPGKLQRLRDLGAEPVLCDAFDADALREMVVSFSARDGGERAHRPAGSARREKRC